MRTIKFTMAAEIDIEDKSFAEHLTDTDKVKIDVLRGHDGFRIKEVYIHHPNRCCWPTDGCKPVPAEPLVHICKKKDYEAWRNQD